METGLVSICSPCYNVARQIPRFLDSLLAQTYKHLEIIIVDDGSTDKTSDVIESYLPRLRAEGYKVTHLRQENAGQAAAINAALQHVHGEFLAWPDSDDWLTPDSIEKRVAYLQAHPEVALVRANVKRIREFDGRERSTFEPTEGDDYAIENFAEKLILCKTWFAPVTSLIRMSHFLEVNPERKIYANKWGAQNLQMLLPLAHRFPCHQMREVLGYYLIRRGSHSHSKRSLDARIAYVEERQRVFLNTLSSIPELEAAYASTIRENDAAECFQLCWKYGQGSRARQYLGQMNVSPEKRAELERASRFPFKLYPLLNTLAQWAQKCLKMGR